MPRLLPDLLREAARQFPAATALASGSAQRSYAELDTLADRLAAALQALDLSGQRVGVLLPNHPTFPIVLYGVLRAGARAVLLNPQYSPREMREVLADSAAAGVVTLEALLPLLPAGVVVWTIDELPACLQIRSAGEDRGYPLPADAPAAATAEPGDEAVVVYTAATRGWARGARLSHRNLLANARSTVQAMQLGPGDRVAAVLPFSHLFGQTVTLNAPLSVGARIFPIERFNPARLLDTLEQEQISVLCGVPAVFAALASVAERRGRFEHALRVAISGGSPLPLSVARHWEQLFGIALRQGYGLTEAGPVCLFNGFDQPNDPATVGYPFPGVEVSVRDPWGDELPQGEVGEICVRGENVFLGYVGERGRQPDDFWAEWLRTGDLGSLESSGAVRYRGILKAMFTRNGFNVYPAEIARVLEADPRIARASVCALPDPARENEIVVFVCPAPGAQIAAEDVAQICNANLASFKQPARIQLETAGKSDDTAA